MYDKDYFKSDYRCGHNSNSAFDVHQDNLPWWCNHLNLASTSRVLEIGCATGYTLRAFNNSGYECFGIEISEDAAEFARKEFSLNVQTAEINRVDFEAEKFELIYLLDVFEHLAAPTDALCRIRRWLKNNGSLVIVIPTQTNTIFSRLGILLYSLIGKRTRINLPPYHLFEYRPTTIERLLRENGFSNIRLYPELMHPSEIALRAGGMQNLFKKVFQYVNWFVIKLFGICGDRLTIIARP